MTRPNREPDFTYNHHIQTYFWFDEDMAELDEGNTIVHKVEDRNGIIFRIDHWNSGKYVKEIQEAYKRHIEKRIEQILLGSETESK